MKKMRGNRIKGMTYLQTANLVIGWVALEECSSGYLARQLL